MCELRDACCVMASDINGDYRRSVYLYCCSCDKQCHAYDLHQPFCDNCCKKLHRFTLTELLAVNITVCERCGLAIRGQIPLSRCNACKSITNFEGYNDQFYQ